MRKERKERGEEGEDEEEKEEEEEGRRTTEMTGSHLPVVCPWDAFNFRRPINS